MNAITSPKRLKGGAIIAALLACALLIWPGVASARYPELGNELGAYRMLGSARYQVLAWTVFDAELWAQQDRFSWDQPFALSLTYRRNISEADLVSRSLNGMAERTQLGSRERLEALLRTCFADVRAGDRFTGVSLGADQARFYLNGRQTCEVSWPGFRQAFFGIWLDARGADRPFSAQLTGSGDRSA